MSEDPYGKEMMFGIYRLYIILGSFAVITNAILLVMLCSCKAFRKRGLLIMVLVLADLINGIAFIVTGQRRIAKTNYLAANNLGVFVPMHECAAEPGPALLVIGGQWPSVLTLILGLERLTAVLVPLWYYKLNERQQFITAAAATIYALASLGAGIYRGLVVTPDIPTIFICGVGKSYGFQYATYNYAITCAGHIVGFAATMTAFVFTRVRMERAGLNRRKELQDLRLVFSISLLSLVFIVVPNVYLILGRFLSHNQTVSGIMYAAFCFRSCANIAIMGLLNKDLRKHLSTIYNRFVKKTTEIEITATPSNNRSSHNRNNQNNTRILDIRL